MTTNNQFALITGGTSGIGLELSRVFAQNGFNLVLVARHADKLNQVSAELTDKFGVQVKVFAFDLFDKESAFALCQEVDRLGITVDVLVNNAGQGLYGKFLDTDIEQELSLLQLNIGAYLVLTKHFLKKMVARNEGRILNVASIASKLPGPYQAVYHGSKAFIHSFTEAVRAEIHDTGVSVTSLLPGATATDFFNKAHMEDSKMLEQRLSDPADVAREGFEALMKGDDMVIPGAKWKAQIAASNFIPDAMLAKTMLKQQGPSAGKTRHQ